MMPLQYLLLLLLHGILPFAGGAGDGGDGGDGDDDGTGGDGAGGDGAGGDGDGTGGDGGIFRFLHFITTFVEAIYIVFSLYIP